MYSPLHLQNNPASSVSSPMTRDAASLLLPSTGRHTLDYVDAPFRAPFLFGARRCNHSARDCSISVRLTADSAAAVLQLLS